MGSDVGGISTLMALDALDKDPATRHIIVICKPPAPEVAKAVMGRIAESTKTFTLCFIGGQAMQLPANAHWARTLSAAAEHAGDIATSANDDTNKLEKAPGKGTSDSSQRSLIRGLFCGGTLCAEAQVMCLDAGLTVSSNAAIPEVSPELAQDGHTLIDLGADEYTQGKPHPMIDPTVRDQLLSDALKDTQCAVVLLDVVLGYGAHADPAGQLVRSLPDGFDTTGVKLIASVTGTEQDPQVLSRQIAILKSAGIEVSISNAAAASLAIEQVQ